MNTTLLRSEDQAWRAILLASQELVSAAQDSRWLDLPQQAEYRDKLIRDYFTRPITTENAVQIQEQIKLILAIDEQILGLARREQEQTGIALKQMSLGSKALKAYQE